MKGKSNKWIIIAIFVVVLLGVSYLILSLVNNSKWTKGLYLYENKVAVSINTPKAEFEIPGIYIGSETDELFKLKEATCILSGNDENILATAKLVAYYQNEHYFDVSLLISCEINEGIHDFDNIEIKLNGLTAFSSTANIRIARETNSTMANVESSIMSSLRTNESLDFIYIIKNISDKPLDITSHENVLNNYNAKLSVINDISEYGEMNLLTSTPLEYPMTIQSGQDVFLYISIPLTESDLNTYIFVAPYFNALYEKKPIKVFLHMLSNYPLLEKTPIEVLEFIEK